MWFPLYNLYNYQGDMVYRYRLLLSYMYLYNTEYNHLVPIDIQGNNILSMHLLSLQTQQTM